MEVQGACPTTLATSTTYREPVGLQTVKSGRHACPLPWSSVLGSQLSASPATIWRLLAGLVNEGIGIINTQRLSSEVRLEQLRERLEFIQQFMRELPPVRARSEISALSIGGST
jgi:hypothetical protein